GEHYVAQHNKLVEHRGGMTLLEQKIIRAVVSQIRMDDQDLKEYELSVVDFKELTGSNHKDLYEQIKAVAEKLIDRKVEIQSITEKGKRGFHLTRYIWSANHVEGEGYFKILIDPKLKPYFLELKEQFTQYQLKYVMKMKSVHALRIYELLKQYENTVTHKREFEIEELKKVLGIEDRYSAIKDFEKYVLLVAKKEINELTDIEIDYKKIYRGRGKKVVSIVFSIDTKLIDEKKYVTWLNETYDIADIKIKSGLRKERFNAKQIMELYTVACDKSSNSKNDIDPFEYIRLNYLYMIEKGTHRSKFKYLLAALQEDYSGAAMQISLNYNGE
ncbi:MAG: replication initiation protein, partial [Nanoarchaeota archaeon]|nr:replication initiation protein [Nanoarchaeota archaeon]